MTTAALITALILHLTGLWPHISDRARQGLTTTATSAVSLAPATVPIPAASVPIPVLASPAPSAPAVPGSVLVLDVATQTVLHQANADQKRPIASTTKLATAITLMSRHQPADLVTIPPLPAYGPEDATIGLIPGEVYRLQDLLQALLIPSANDAADALAIWDAGSIPAFTAHMNQKMTQWGIKDAHFTTPSGLHEDAGNRATARSLARIAALALAQPLIKDAVAQTSGTITSQSGRTLELKTTNPLLASGDFYGIKTGYTPAAGQCFVGLTRVKGHEVITVVLGQDDRFGVTTSLITWIGQYWQWL